MPSIPTCRAWLGRRSRSRCSDERNKQTYDKQTYDYLINNTFISRVCNSLLTMQDERATVVVVGAGVAGLTAANRLRQLGIEDVLVVEAADHVGGRIKQVEGVLPWPVELGPEFVHGAKSSLKVLRCVGQTRTLCDSSLFLRQYLSR